MARADFNVRAGKVAWRYTAPAALFFGHGSTVAVLPSTARIEKMLAGYQSIAVAARFGYSLDFPEHPDNGNAEADDDAQEQQRQAGGCEHGDHP
jgi:hypothetical protein